MDSQTEYAPYVPGDVPLAAIPSHETKPQTVPKRLVMSVEPRVCSATHPRVETMQEHSSELGVGGRLVAATQAA